MLHNGDDCFKWCLLGGHSIVDALIIKKIRKLSWKIPIDMIDVNSIVQEKSNMS